MAIPAICVEQLSKAYRIGVRADKPTSLRASFLSAITAPIRQLRQLSQVDATPHSLGVARADIYWALRDVSFEVPEGEVLGVIGRNGAGKSTLLKILSRITEPTLGNARIKGRMSSLLEVGTGFHPELSGRDNVYLNGTILGMTKKEIDRKFSEIVEFSGVQKFLDTPIKRYSSGMKVRLAFAVAAHLEPEILIVDEVLAVGDAEFQRKCMSKMQNVARGGRTVLFVSHSMAAIQSLCDSCLVLDHGTVSFHGPTKAAVDVYRKTNDHVTEAIQTPISGENVTLTRFTTTSNTTSPARVIDFGAPLTLSLSVNVAEHVPNLHLRLIIFRVSDDLRVSSFSTRETPIGPLPAGETHLDISTSSLLLFPGEYYWSLSVLTSHHVYLDIECAERFSVHPHILEGCPSAYEAAHGVFHFPLDIRVAHDSRPTTYQVLKGATIF